MCNDMVSVVIPSHGRADLVAATTAPLLEDPATLEVIVVADRDEEVLRAAQALGHPKLRAIATDAGLPSVARQAGVEAARGEFVLILDDDVIAEPGLVSGHLAAHGRPGLVVVGYMPVASERLQGAGRFLPRMYSASYESHVALFERDPSRILPHFWAGNASMRRDDALRVGIHNEGWKGRFYEDFEFGGRCAAAGLEGVFRRDLAGVHHFERSVPAWRRRSRQQGAATKLRIRPSTAAHVADLALVWIMLAGTYVAGALHLWRVQAALAWHAHRADARRGLRDVRNGRNLDELVLR
jgi:glycosyltransferase involved in cell wall biosynthesis